MKDIRITDIGATAIKEALKLNSTLKVLKLYGNHISQQLMKDIELLLKSPNRFCSESFDCFVLNSPKHIDVSHHRGVVVGTTSSAGTGSPQSQPRSQTQAQTTQQTLVSTTTPQAIESTSSPSWHIKESELHEKEIELQGRPSLLLCYEWSSYVPKQNTNRKRKEGGRQGTKRHEARTSTAK